MGMTGFHGQGSREFALAAGGVAGYRWWCLDAPDLRLDPLAADINWRRGPLLGQRRTYRWNAGVNESVCDVYPDHATPLEDCDSGCGFWAYWAPPEVPHFRSDSLWLLGVIEGFGRTLIGTEGFRCQKARIAALHLASQFALDIPAGNDWHADWHQVFSQPGTHKPPHGRPPPGGVTRTPVPPAVLAEATDWMQAWQAVIEDRLGLMHPDTRIIAKRRALLALYPPFYDRARV